MSYTLFVGSIGKSHLRKVKVTAAIAHSNLIICNFLTNANSFLILLI